MNQQDVLNEVLDKFGEYIEMEGERSPVLVTHILCTMVMKEREKVEHYKKLAKVMQ